MNEKIKRLLPNPFAVDYIGTDEPIDLYTEKEMLEFAEIIIKECAKLAQGDRGGDEYWRARASSRADILKHFGIEQ